MDLKEWDHIFRRGGPSGTKFAKACAKINPNTFQRYAHDDICKHTELGTKLGRKKSASTDHKKERRSKSRRQEKISISRWKRTRCGNTVSCTNGFGESTEGRGAEGLTNTQSLYMCTVQVPPEECTQHKNTHIEGRQGTARSLQ